MALHDYKFPRPRGLVRDIPTVLAAVAFLLIAFALAALLPLQAPAGMTGALAPAAAPGNPPVSAQAVPKAVLPPAADEPLAVPAPADGPVATPAQPTAPSAAPAGSAITTNQYIVVAGDTVGAIAARFGVDVSDMLAANGLGAFTIIRPGQTLKLSGPPVEVPRSAAPIPQARPAVRTVFVAGSGGQAMVDRCIGPIHFTPTDAYTLFIVEHEFCGGWERFSGIRTGESVVISGYGTYTAAGRGQVPKGGTTNDVAAVFGGFPRAILQTCIPGTNTMLLIALN